MQPVLVFVWGGAEPAALVALVCWLVGVCQVVRYVWMNTKEWHIKAGVYADVDGVDGVVWCHT